MHAIKNVFREVFQVKSKLRDHVNSIFCFVLSEIKIFEVARLREITYFCFQIKTFSLQTSRWNKIIMPGLFDLKRKKKQTRKIKERFLPKVFHYYFVLMMFVVDLKILANSRLAQSWFEKSNPVVLSVTS